MLKNKRIGTTLGWFGSQNPKIIILGTIPSKTSDGLKQYYSHHNNRFWETLASVFNESNISVTSTYDEKEQFLIKYNISLNDVFESVSIEGSSDESISRDVNLKYNFGIIQDILSFNAPVVLFNGSGKKTKTKFRPFISELIANKIPYDFLDSSSSRNRKYNKDKSGLYEQWKNIIHKYIRN